MADKNKTIKPVIAYKPYVPITADINNIKWK